MGVVVYGSCAPLLVAWHVDDCSLGTRASALWCAAQQRLRADRLSVLCPLVVAAMLQQISLNWAKRELFTLYCLLCNVAGWYRFAHASRL